MQCRKCRAEIPDNSKYCLSCGARQDITRNPKSRGNGQGSVYQLPNKRWIAIKTVRYEATESGKQKRITRSKSGFRTKKEAVEYLSKLDGSKKATPEITFYKLYETWAPTHRAGKSTVDGYKFAIKYFRPVWNYKLSEISIDDLQQCMDECPKGKRTRENMKAACGLMYKYAIPRGLASLNLAQYLIVGSGDAGEKEALPDDALSSIEKNVNKIPGADYVVCQCYLGFRPSEFIGLDVKSYNRKERAFIDGAKTEAGKNRVVTISPKIQPIIDRLTDGKDSGPVFSGNNGSFMTIKEYRELFYNVLEKCGIDNPILKISGVERHKYTPHSCRHTFATMMKRVQGSDKDKMELIGHSSSEMLRHYQDVNYDDLRKITDQI